MTRWKDRTIKYGDRLYTDSTDQYPVREKAVSQELNQIATEINDTIKQLKSMTLSSN